MNSYVPYNGSKSRAMTRLAPILNPLPSETYIDGLFGGGSVFFGKPKAGLNILNDADADVMGMHQAVAGNPRGVMKEMKRLPTARLQYDDIRRVRETGDWWKLTPEQRAARMIYVFACAINAKPNSPFPASTMTRLNFHPDRDLRPWAEMLAGVTLECLEIQELLDRYVLKQKKIRVLLYLDPPYVIAAKNSHYRYCFDAVDHLLLARKLALISERNVGDRAVRIVVSYDDHEFIRALYRPEFG